MLQIGVCLPALLGHRYPQARYRYGSGGRLLYPLLDGIPIPGLDPSLDARFGEISGQGQRRISVEGNDSEGINFLMAHEFSIAGMLADFLCLGHGSGLE